MAALSRPEAAPSSEAGDSAILVEGLHKRYGASGPEAVAGIDLAIPRGQIYGLLGPNGAGKTTTIGVITTRVRASSGRVLVDGLDVAVDPVAVKLRLAVVPQRSNLDRSLSAIENLTFHAGYFGAGRRERRARARALMAEVGLEGREGDRVANYSGGMAQRLMIARALMHDPQILILDEPTTGLDPQSRLFLWETMRKLRATGRTIVLTTHDMLEADQLCDRISIIDHGLVIASDTPLGLRRLLPSEDGIELIVEGAGDPSATLEALAGVERLVETEAVEGRRTLRCFGPVDPSAVVAAVEASAVRLVELRRLEGSLEDVFMHLTGRDLR